MVASCMIASPGRIFPVPSCPAFPPILPQHVPDTVHHPNFPGSVTLGPGEAYAQHTSYAFALY